jgi:hypothetical protein
MRSKWIRLIWLMTGLVLLVAASRALRMSGFLLDNDEIWTIWQTFGTPQQIIQWTSANEHPLYFLLLGFWKMLAGFHPDVLRYLSLLLSLPGIAFIYRAVRRTHGNEAGILAALAYSTFSISIFISLYARSYAIAQATLPFLLWMIHRYFDLPSFKRSLPVALALFLLYTATITIVPALILMGLYTLLVFRQRVWRWWLPGMIALVLVLPDIVTNKLAVVGFHSSATRMFALPALPGALIEFFNYFTGFTPVWYALVIIAGLLILMYGLPRLRSINLFWLGWTLLVPLLLYFLEPRLGFYNLKRYGWWYVLGVAILIGTGIAKLSRPARSLVGMTLIIIMFLPFHLGEYGYIVTALGENLHWLTDHLQANDKLVLDPNLGCNYPEEWDYYTRLYFPMGLPIINAPDNSRRLWYAVALDDTGKQTVQRLEQSRVAGRFVGPPGCFFRLYESPPDSKGTLFENGMRFHGLEFMDGDKPRSGPLAFREGEPFRVRLWWSVDKPIQRDYSVGLYLLRDKLYGQSDGPPQTVYPVNAPPETSRWQPGQIYVEEREMQIPYPIGRGDLVLDMAVYWFGDNSRSDAPGTTPEKLLPIERLAVISW